MRSMEAGRSWHHRGYYGMLTIFSMQRNASIKLRAQIFSP
jgi:hypothetical protein